MPSHHQHSGSNGGNSKATWAPHCLHCLLRRRAVVLADARAIALLPPASLAEVLADARATALLALPSNAVVLADARATALLALPSNAVVLADARATALLALPSNAARFSIRNKITDLKIIMPFFW